MKLLMLAGLLAASAVTVGPGATGAFAHGRCSSTHYDPNIPTTSDRSAPVMDDCSPSVAGYNDRTGYRRVDVENISGNPIRVVGRVTGGTSRMMSRKVHVRLDGGQGWTINAPSSVFSIDEYGDRLSVHDLRPGDWVVAEGRRIGDSRIRALALRRLGEDVTDYRDSVFFRPDREYGYAMNITAGPNFPMQARESIMGISSQVAGERQETRKSHKQKMEKYHEPEQDESPAPEQDESPKPDMDESPQ